MKKWLLVLAVLVVVGVGAFLTLRDSLATRHDWSTYAGTYVASGPSSHSETGDLLVLRADGTWEQRRDDTVVDKGGKATSLPGPNDLEKLNWLGPRATSDCVSEGDKCPQPSFGDGDPGPLVYVPVVSRKTTNKGDFTTSGHYFRVVRDGAVLVDEEGVSWTRRSHAD